MDKVSVPKHIQELRGYKPGKVIEELIKEYGLTETAVLWNNENNLGPSPKALEAIQKSLSNSNLYPDPTAYELRKAIADKESISPEQVVVGNGSEAILGNIFQAFVDEGEELLTSQGTFVAVYIWAMSHNIPIRTLPLTTDYGFDLDHLASEIRPNTKLVYIANPNNPTGAMITRDELEAFMKKVPSSVLVISDEAYYEYAIDLNDQFADSVRMDYPNLLTLRTFSKAYGIASIRIGYAMGPLNLIETLAKVKMTFEPSNLAQAAGVGALSDVDYLSETMKNNKEGLQMFYALFDELGVKYVPSFANFVMIDLGSEEQVVELANELQRNGVFVRPLKAFGLPHCMRISVGLARENELFVKCFRELF